jgi:hypothetical protein
LIIDKECIVTPQPTIVAAWSKSDRAAIWVLLIGATAIALIALVAAVLSVVSDLTSGSRTLGVLVTTPLPPEASTGTATIVTGTYESAWLTVTGLSAGTAAVLTAGSVLAAITQIATAATFAYLAFRLLQRRPFLASLSTAFYVAGSVLAIGGLVAGFLRGFGGWQVVTELSSAQPNVDSFWPLMMEIDPAPIGWGFALLAIAVAFQFATKLTRETDGLV